MVEDMYQQEFQEAAAKDDEEEEGNQCHDANSEINAAPEKDTSENQDDDLTMPTEYRCFMENPEIGLVGRGGAGGGAGNLGTQAAGEVSLTLGLRRSENVPIMSHLSVRDFEAY